jgi:hypothetical protein
MKTAAAAVERLSGSPRDVDKFARLKPLSKDDVAVLKPPGVE